MLRIEHDPSRQILGTTAAQDFTISVDSVTPNYSFRTVRSGDAFYSLPNALVKFAVAKGAQMTEPVVFVADTVEGVQISADEFLVNNYPIPTFVSQGSYGYSGGISEADANFVKFGVTASSSKATRRVSASFQALFGVQYLTLGLESGGRPEVVSIDASSLATHITNNVNAMIASRTPSAASQRLLSSISTEFGGLTAATSTATRSSTHIAAAYDLCACSVWSAQTAGGQVGQQLPAVLITPLHAYVSHVTRGVGEEFTWITSDNQKRTRTIAAVLMENPGGWQVVRLNAPITDIAPFEIVPPNILDYLPSLRSYRRFVPCVSIARNFGYGGYDGGVVALRSMSTLDSNFKHLRCLETAYAPWTWNLIIGDSNNPVMFPVNGKMMLMGTEYYGVGGISLANPQRNNAMPQGQTLEAIVATSSGGYQITRTDLSMFPAYI